jgi:hypothetical protein
LFVVLGGKNGGKGDGTDEWKNDEEGDWKG